jgi:hypothetical protein
VCQRNDGIGYRGMELCTLGWGGWSGSFRLPPFEFREFRNRFTMRRIASSSPVGICGSFNSWSLSRAILAARAISLPCHFLPGFRSPFRREYAKRRLHTTADGADLAVTRRQDSKRI